MKPIVISCLLLFLAGAANGVMDALQFHYAQTPFDPDDQFWNPKISWENKWAKDQQGELQRPLRPRFFGASTFLVFLTDAWHLFQMIMFTAFHAAVIVALSSCKRLGKGWWNVAAWIGIYLLLHTIQSVGFHIIYTWAW